LSFAVAVACLAGTRAYNQTKLVDYVVIIICGIYILLDFTLAGLLKLIAEFRLATNCAK